MNEADEEAQMVRLQEIMEEELEKGTIEDFGRSHLYYHFRTLGHRDVVITQRLLRACPPLILSGNGITLRGNLWVTPGILRRGEAAGNTSCS